MPADRPEPEPSEWDGAKALAPQPRKLQPILNEHWPLHDRQGYHARGIPDQPHPIAVHARVVWERDGPEWIHGRATRWTRDAVFVAFADPRRDTAGVWLRPDDVVRR